MTRNEADKRQAIIDACRRMNQIVFMTMDGSFADMQIGTPPVPPSDEIERVRRKMTGYGHADG